MGNSEEKSLTQKLDYVIFVHCEAQLEVQEAFDYYREINNSLGFEFMRSLETALQNIKRNPFSYQKIYKETRRTLLRKFPYAIFYFVEKNKIVILSCFHQKRNEINWLKRI